MDLGKAADFFSSWARKSACRMAASFSSVMEVLLQTYIQALTIRASDMSALSAEQMMAVMPQRTFNAVKIVVSTAPILLLYPLMQRFVGLEFPANAVPL